MNRTRLSDNYIDKIYRQLLEQYDQTDEQINEASLNIQQQLTHFARATNVMKLPQFISNMKFTKNKQEQYVLLIKADDIQIGGKSISDWYDIYLTEAQQYNTPKKEANSIRRVSQQSQDNEQDDQLSLFPFRSKIKQYERINKEKITIPTQIKDIKVKPLSKLQRPYFSPKIGSWEIDIIFGTNPSTRRTRLYLFAININTKYLVVIPMKDKSSDQLKIALKKLMKQVYVNNIRGDGETGFKANVIKQLCDENHITSYFTSSPYTQHNRIVDSVIRTIRNGFGQDLISFANPNKMQQMVDIYNKTPHLAYQNQFTPQQVQLSRDLEGKFIRKKQQQLELQLIKQQREKLFDFKSGNILMVHVDYSRTGIRFQKQRRQFNELATFITYKNGNVVCKLLNPYEGISVIELPIYYCKFISDDLNSLPANYKSQFNITN